MTDDLEEWQLHVIKDTSTPIGLPKKAWCGAVLGAHDFGMLGEHHARACVETKNRLQPCPKCWAAIQEGYDDTRKL